MPLGELVAYLSQDCRATGNIPEILAKSRNVKAILLNNGFAVQDQVARIEGKKSYWQKIPDTTGYVRVDFPVLDFKKLVGNSCSPFAVTSRFFLPLRACLSAGSF